MLTLYSSDDEVIQKPYATNKDQSPRPRGLYVGVVLFCFLYGFAFSLFAPFAMIAFAVPLVVLALVVIWALPESRRAPVNALYALFVLNLTASAAWPDYLALALPGMPWITAARLTGIPLTLTLLLCVSVSREFRSAISRAISATPIIYKCLIGFIIIAGVTIVFSETKIASIDKFLLVQFTWVAVFFSSVAFFTAAGRVQIFSILFSFLAIFVSIIGVAEWRVGHVIWADHVPFFLKIEDPSVAKALMSPVRDGVIRVKSTFSTALGLGEFLALALPFIVQFATGRYPIFWRVVAGFAIILVLFAAKLSGSRLGMVGCVIALALHTVIWAILKSRRNRRSLLGPILVVAAPTVVLAFVVAVVFVGRLRHLIWGNGSTGSSDDARKVQWAMGLPKIISHPWGHGIGTGGITLGYAPFGFLTIDSYYLSALLEFGVVGFILFYGMFVAAGFYSGSSILNEKNQNGDLVFLKPAFISIINFLIVTTVFSETGNHTFAFMMLGMVVALIYRSSIEVRIGKTPSSLA